jgi:acyl-CoA thioester hydrolase
MPYFDLSRTEYLRHLGRIELGAADFVMRAMTVEYHAPARFDDLLEIFVRAERVGRTSLTFDHAAYRIEEDGGDTLMATAKQTLVLIEHDTRRPLEVPAEYRERLAAFEGVPV